MKKKSTNREGKVSKGIISKDVFSIIWKETLSKGVLEKYKIFQQNAPLCGITIFGNYWIALAFHFFS